MANGERRLFFAAGLVMGILAAVFGQRYASPVKVKVGKWLEDKRTLAAVKSCCDSCGDFGHSRKTEEKNA
ncbi:MAG: hypothetical protein WC449_00715 [Candidatus Paceibacterota bacterium]